MQDSITAFTILANEIAEDRAAARRTGLSPLDDEGGAYGTYRCRARFSQERVFFGAIETFFWKNGWLVLSRFGCRGAAD